MSAHLIYLHTLSSKHKALLEREEKCCCFYCTQSFDTGEIKEWTDKGLTALCPLCGIDAVLPGVLTDEDMQAMYKHYF